MAFEPITIPLSEPITHGKETYTELKFTRLMRGREMLAMDAVQGGMRKTYALYASLADVPIQVIYDMLTSDLGKVALVVAALTGESSPAKGESPATE